MLDTSIARPWLALAFLVWTLLAAIAGWQTGREQEQDRCTAQVATLKADQATQYKDWKGGEPADGVACKER